MNTPQGITTVENAGKYLVKTRSLHVIARDSSFTATRAAYSEDPDVQALAVLSVLLARITGAKDDGWVAEICDELGIES